MKLDQHSSPHEPVVGTLLPVAWLLIAVVAPAGLVWLIGRDRVEPSTVLDSSLAGFARPEQVLAEHRAKAQDWLESYGWVDREGGIARVPIEEGMKVVLREGLPARENMEEER